MIDNLSLRPPVGGHSTPTRRRLGLLGFGAAVLAGPAPRPATALAQPSPWPDRPVRLVIPFGAGGAIDTLARLLAPHFPAHAGGHSLVVDNRPGAGGTVAAAHVAQARPDGYTLLMADLGPNATAGEVYGKALPYDPARAFTPIVYLADLPMVFVARPGLDARDLAELIAHARLRPGALTYASVGSGHVSHLGMELLQRMAGGGGRLLHVSYRGGAEAVGALVRGEADLTLTSVSTALPFVRSGAVRALAVASAMPVPALPGTPTAAGAVPGFGAALWYGVVGPAGMAAEAVFAANRTFNAVLAAPEVGEVLRRVQSAEVIGGPPERLAAHVQAEIARWAPVVRAAGMRAE